MLFYPIRKYHGGSNKGMEFYQTEAHAVDIIPCKAICNAIRHSWRLGCKPSAVKGISLSVLFAAQRIASMNQWCMEPDGSSDGGVQARPHPVCLFRTPTIWALSAGTESPRFLLLWPSWASGSKIWDTWWKCALLRLAETDIWFQF